MRTRTAPRRPARRRRPEPLLYLRRRPRLRLALGALLLAAALAIAQQTLAAGAAERAGWGRREAVVVATGDVEPGEELSAATAAVRQLPAALVPAGALSALPEGQVARAALYEGEVVLAERLAPAGLRGVAALVPAGERAVAVPVAEGAAPRVGVGDRVDVVVALSPDAGAGGGPPAFVVAEAAKVVDVADESVSVAVDRDAAPRVAFAVSQGLVTLALVGAR